MKSVTVDFSSGYIGVIARQGEHNKTQLVFSLPSSFDGADYINAEFTKRDGTTAVIERLIPDDGHVTVPITQELTNMDARLDIQLVAYEVDGDEIIEIAKSAVVRGTIDRSLNVLYSEDRPGFIERVIAFINSWSPRLADLWNSMHRHENQDTLDNITADDIGIAPDWNENDPQSKNYIVNRTHWRETETIGGYNYMLPEDKTGLVDIAVDISGDLNLPEGTIVNHFYRVGDNVNMDVFNNSVFVFSVPGEELTFVVNGSDNPYDLIDVEAENAKLILIDSYMLMGLNLDASAMINVVSDNVTISLLGHDVYVAESGLYFSYIDLSAVTGTPNTELKVISASSDSIQRVVYHPLSDNYLSANVLDAIDKKHTHSNKDALDSVTAQTLSDISSNTSARHTHSNKSTLDNITAQTLSDISSNTSARHTHSNKTTLDKLREQHITDIGALHNNSLLLQNLSSRSFASTGTGMILCYSAIPVNGVIKVTIIGNGYEGVLKAGALFYFSDVQTGDNDNAIIITGFENNAGYPYPEYIMDFTTGSTAPTFTLPISGVTWVEELTIEANKHYQISIANGVGLWCAVDVEAVSS